ncbi:uncharacterized protein EDB93DRAFT_1246952 [Suillus bovinus]|uniref:uncharacterized protein n=1 Tax=Suillus bovinus TaxID=48563 RepID=UPI001B8856D3|nr:uncharacterized protein EDB93DRAFT_1246952 [Suillus bovinus]KAG2156762.1 hypothetical protein EDB93DRAFT_1246952 [Suillus bovinus]
MLIKGVAHHSQEVSVSILNRAQAMLIQVVARHPQHAVSVSILFLEDLKKVAPKKFHSMMADIYESVEALKQKGGDNQADEHRKVLVLLDLDGMGED